MATGERGEDAASIARRVPEEVITGRNLDLIDEVFAEDCAEHGPFGEELRGRGELRAALGGFLDAFPDFEASVEDAVASGDTAAMRVTLRGTHEGPMMGIEPTGESFEVRNMVFTRSEGGRVVERWVQPDSLGMMVQLGIVESPISAPADPGAGD